MQRFRTSGGVAEVLKCRGAAVENCWKRRRGGDGMQRSCRGAEEVLKRCLRGAKEVQRCRGAVV